MGLHDALSCSGSLLRLWLYRTRCDGRFFFIFIFIFDRDLNLVHLIDASVQTARNLLCVPKGRDDHVRLRP